MNRKYIYTVNRVETMNVEIELEDDDEPEDFFDAAQQQAYEIGEWKPLEDEVICKDPNTGDEICMTYFLWGKTNDTHQAED